MANWKDNWYTDNKLDSSKTLNSALGMLGAAGSLFSTAYGMATPDTDSVKQRVDTMVNDMKANQSVQNTNSLDDLMGQWSAFKALDTDYNYKDYYKGPSTGDIFKNSLSSTISGATSGATAGILGAGIGAAAGLASGIVGGLIGKNKATKVAKQAALDLSNQAKENNAYKLNTFATQANSINQQNYRDKMASIYALGGPLGISLVPVNGAIDYMQNEDLLSTFGDNMTKNNNGRTSMPKFAFGGALGGYGGDWSNGLVEVNAGNTHGKNPLGGVPMGIAEDGQPNLVEEGEVIYNDYVFSNRLRVPKEVRSKYKLRDNATFADAVKQMQKSSKERPNDPIEKRTLETMLNDLMQSQEGIRQKKAEKAQQQAMALQQEAEGLQQQAFAYGGNLGRILAGPGGMSQFLNIPDEPETDEPEIEAPKGTLAWSDNPANQGEPYHEYIMPRTTEGTPPPPPKKTNNWESYLRYAPVLGSAINAGVALFDKPDYQYADALERAAQTAASNYNHVSPTMLGDYLAYNPFDRLFYANQLASQAAATRRGILNLSNGNRGAAMAGLLNADYNAQEQLGKLYREGEKYNLDQRQKVAEFNRGTNQYNATADLEAQTANAKTDAAKADLLYKAAIEANQMRQAEDNLIKANRNVALTSLFDNIGDVGREAVERNMVFSNPALYYTIGRDGSISYKNMDGLSEKDKDFIQWHAERAAQEKKGKSNANGGYLTIKNRRRR